MGESDIIGTVGATGYNHKYMNLSPQSALMKKIKKLGYTKEDINIKIKIDCIEGSNYRHIYTIYKI